ncbi:DMT family transporter [Porticoccaceae bacterium LTM1]|nr:DMT family transporter [Porticoccaceae bacterium LTM1]
MGVIAALTAALCWALATRIYRGMGAFWSPLSLTFIKNFIAIGLFGLAIFLSSGDFVSGSSEAVWWLILSGAIGIGIGDVSLFKALNTLGEARTLMVAETLAPILVVVIAWLALSEQLSWLQLFGVVVIIFAVDMVISFRSGRRNNSLNYKGLLWAMLAACCQATGAVISRAVFTSSDISAEASALWRLLGGLSLALILLIINRHSLKPKSALTKYQWGSLLAAIVIGTFIAIWALQLSFKLLPAGIAQTLIVTCALMAALIAAFKGERLSPKQWFGLVLGVPGVAMLVL